MHLYSAVLASLRDLCGETMSGTAKIAKQDAKFSKGMKVVLQSATVMRRSPSFSFTPRLQPGGERPLTVLRTRFNGFLFLACGKCNGRANRSNGSWTEQPDLVTGLKPRCD